MELGALKDNSNRGSSSTTFEWRRVKISRPPEATRDSAAKRHRWRRFPKRNARDPITVRIWLRGGAEAWVAVSGRGETNFYPGVTSVYDILADINQLGQG